MWLHVKYDQRLTWRSTFPSTVWSTRPVASPKLLDLEQNAVPTVASKVVSLETAIRKQTSLFFFSFFSFFLLTPYLPGQLWFYLLADSSVAHKSTWPNGILNACIRAAYCYQNGMWEYAMHLGFEKWPRKKKSRSKGWYIYIYINAIIHKNLV